ncbi:tRNA (adenosine(37)-N6)-threonylcarbamoyltransferase complex dimerization subunit type 1 TsaB [Thetidibacter halocola]|uniref:tRNA (Adenosine(37)-N6)-threonylcarbamoyltransferase complex dimerization subunit type 1 TsaB n=1 Tax=Thetidibacter halocola TaxID=2827239 RepID=A0A8J7WC66_9RHOB|nr:tRNA (adenosine(37)-N6)-threonylcarbamoyltransferase complex dimerization subunit type 1 TsaB [Thetidibacter halocola]MBS0124850.1 tRNA (adenosine(37)-N6)-threonylcarbamoyltransferase complex dimerization subunit type 1 TsaB [Thetidibacter halocola]
MPSEPLVLAFDTSAAHCAAALLSGDTVLASRTEDMGRGQAERLMAMLQELLDEAGRGWRDLDAIGVGIGPGNFTGIRISVATARGLALGLGIPAVGVSGFEARALDIAPPLVVLIDAPRQLVYVQNRGLEGWSRVDLLPLDALESVRPGADGRWVGQHAGACAERLGGEAVEPRHPLAEAIARVAATRFRDPALARPAPLYVRPADAAPSREVAPVLLDDA